MPSPVLLFRITRSRFLFPVSVSSCFVFRVLRSVFPLSPIISPISYPRSPIPKLPSTSPRSRSSRSTHIFFSLSLYTTLVLVRPSADSERILACSIYPRSRSTICRLALARILSAVLRRPRETFSLRSSFCLRRVLFSPALRRTRKTLRSVVLACDAISLRSKSLARASAGSRRDSRFARWIVFSLSLVLILAPLGGLSSRFARRLSPHTSLRSSLRLAPPPSSLRSSSVGTHRISISRKVAIPACCCGCTLTALNAGRTKDRANMSNLVWG